MFAFFARACPNLAKGWAAMLPARLFVPSALPVAYAVVPPALHEA